jgi:two-component system, NarL family, nitrate/nitrite response regulator NarL
MSTTFIVDSNRLSREGMVRLLSDTNFEVLGHAGDIEELDAVAAEHGHPELLLLDLPRETDGLKERLVELRERAPAMKVVILTTSVQPRPLAEYFGVGVDGYLLKDISTEALIGSLNLVLAGERVFPSQLIPLILRGTSSMPTMANTATAEGAHLSDRELQILGCLVEGASNKMIANRLSVTEATIKVHVKSILRKINAQNRTQAAIWALNNGIHTDSSLLGQANAN